MALARYPAQCIGSIIILLGLASCGVPDSTSTSAQRNATPSVTLATQTPLRTPTVTPTLASTATAQPSSTITTEVVPAATVVPVNPIRLVLNNIAWSLAQPQNVPPQIAANTAGLLWVKFPPMVTNDNIVRYAMNPIPQGNYDLMFTPLRAGGGNVEQAAQRILTLPNIIGNDDVFIVNVAAAGPTHFVVRTYELLQGAQSGGTSRIRWIEPQTATVKEVVTAVEGGGKFLTTAQNDRWLFWNRYEVGATSLYAPGAEAFLVDLETGRSHEITLGGANVANSAEWEKDGKLYFKTGQEQKEYVFDPITNQVAARP